MSSLSYHLREAFAKYLKKQISVPKIFTEGKNLQTVLSSGSAIILSIISLAPKAWMRTLMINSFQLNSDIWFRFSLDKLETPRMPCCSWQVIDLTGVPSLHGVTSITMSPSAVSSTLLLHQFPARNKEIKAERIVAYGFSLYLFPLFLYHWQNYKPRRSCLYLRSQLKEPWRFY